MVRPEPLTLADHEQRARGDALALIKKSQPVTGQLTLAEAIARGLTDNLDHRLSLMERALNETQLSLIQFDMLPKIAAGAGYDWRDRVRASSSIGLESGEQSLTSSYSDERIGTDYNLNLSWSVLDFGLSYFRAKQQADRVLIAVETRRKVINNTTRQIISAYYRAATADKLLPRVRSTIRDAQGALASADQTQAEKLLPPDQMLVYKRDLLQNLITLQNFESRLNAAKQELAALINVPMSQDLRFAPVKKKRLPKLKATVEKLQEFGLVNRSELREEVYKQRIERNNVNQEILKLFPALSAVGSYNYDSNKYLFYNRWQELGLKAAWNLVDVMKGPTALNAAKGQVEYAGVRRLAVSTAIMAQIAISYHQYEEARNNYALADQMRDIEAQILNNANDAAEAETVSRIDVIRQKVAALAAEIESGQQYAEGQTALAGVMTSVGYDLVPASIEATTEDRTKLISEIDTVITAVQSGQPIMTLPAADTAAIGHKVPPPEMVTPVKPQRKPQSQPIVKPVAKVEPVKAEPVITVQKAAPLTAADKKELAKLADLHATPPKPKAPRDDSLTAADRKAVTKLPKLAKTPPVKQPPKAALRDDSVTTADKKAIAKLAPLSKTPPKAAGAVIDLPAKEIKAVEKPVAIAADKESVKKDPVKPVDTPLQKTPVVAKAQPEKVIITDKDRQEMAKLAPLSKTPPKIAPKVAPKVAPKAAAPVKATTMFADPAQEAIKAKPVKTEVVKIVPVEPEPVKAPVKAAAPIIDMAPDESKVPAAKAEQARIVKEAETDRQEAPKEQAAATTPAPPAKAAKLAKEKTPAAAATPSAPARDMFAVSAPKPYVAPVLPAHIQQRSQNVTNETEQLAKQPQFQPGYQYNIAPEPGTPNTRTIQE